MVRQAHAYLVSAISGATVIAIAIVAFVVLISAQFFRDWPIAALGGGDEKAALSEASAVSSRGGPAVAVAKTVNPGATATGAGATGRGGNPAGGGSTRAAPPQPNSSIGSSAPPVTASEPVGGGPESDGDRGSTGSSPSNPPSPSTPASNSSPAPSSGGGGNATSGSGGSGNSGTSGGSKSGSGNVVEEVVGPVTGGGGSTSAKVTETVNETVNSVDETVTGGALQETGVTQVTEEVVNGVAGPESVVGKIVDELGNAVGGLLGGKK